MTVTSTISRNDYLGTGTLDTYDFTFRVFQAEDLLVTTRDLSDVETTLVLDVDYTVEGVGNESGTITLTAGNLTDGYHLTVRRVCELIQETDIRNQGPYYPELHENELDRCRMIDQQLQDSIDRSMRLAETVSGCSVILPIPDAFKVLRWNATEDALENATMATTGEVSLPSTSGVAIYDGNLSFLTREIVGVSGVQVVNGTGLAGDPTISIASGGVDAVKMDLTDSYDFTGGAVDVETQAPGTSGTSAASTAYVRAAVDAIETDVIPIPVTTIQAVSSGMAVPVEVWRDGFRCWRFGSFGSAVGTSFTVQVPPSLPADWGGLQCVPGRTPGHHRR